MSCEGQHVFEVGDLFDTSNDFLLAAIALFPPLLKNGKRLCSHSHRLPKFEELNKNSIPPWPSEMIYSPISSTFFDFLLLHLIVSGNFGQ